jgi:methylmalonyl-CoA/ethylmalonyl-CoA epimerase
MTSSHPLLQNLTLDHVGIATPDLDAASAPFELLGLPRDSDDEEISQQGVRVRAFRSGESLVELLEPTTQESPIRGFLERRGPGLHHLALRVARLEEEMARLKAAGARFVSDDPQRGRHGTRVVFLHPKWAGGVLVELVEHPVLNP